MPSAGSGWPPISVCTGWLSGSYLSASVKFSTTVTVTGTSSVVPSGYVTIIVPSLSPAVVVSTGSFHAYVVPSGISVGFLIPVDASG